MLLSNHAPAATVAVPTHCRHCCRGLEAIAGAGVKLPDSMCLRRGSVVRFRGTKMYTTEASPWSHGVNR